MFRFGQLSRIALAASPFALSASVAYAESNKNPVGVYVWGDNSNGLISATPEVAIRAPTFVPFFKDKKLKDLSLSSQVAVAVLSNGSVYQWTSPDAQYQMLKGETIEQVSVFDDLIVARSKGGQLYSWHATSSAGHVQKFKLPSLGWFEKIVDFKMGRDHIVARTNKGHALTGLTRDVASHDGQLGLASHSALDPAPPAYEMRQVKLLNRENIVKVASGVSHVLFQTQEGSVYGCGSNFFGQLGLPFNNNKPKYSVPVKVNPFEVADIAAGSDISIFRSVANSVSVVGDGINGHFGTGSFSNMQNSPIQIPFFNNLSEYNEKLQAVQPLVPIEWSISTSHIFTELSNAAHDWYEWGSNHRGELGNGKLSRVVKPASIEQSILKDLLNANRFVAGPHISAAYTKA